MADLVRDDGCVQSQSSVANNSELGTPDPMRIHYLDNLRAFAMLLGVLLHSGLAYAKPAQSVWLATDSQSSVVVDAMIWFIHLFRMSLFFLLSGYFARVTVERKGTRKFLWNRFLRIVVPFVLFYPALLFVMSIVLGFGLSYVDQPRGVMGLIAAAIRNNSKETNAPPPGTMHLWFLYYLMAFCLLSVLLRRVRWFSLEEWFPWKHFGWLCPLILVPGILYVGNPLPAPDSFMPQCWPFVNYGVFFLAGWKLFGNESILNSWRPYVWHSTVAAVATYAVYYWLMPELELSVLIQKKQPPIGWQSVVEAILMAILSVQLTVTSLLLGQLYLSSRNSWLRWISDSSYWVYLIHLPIVIFLQTLLLRVDWPIWLKLSTVVLGTMISCLATYLVLVRYTPLGWLLHGKREFP